MENKIRELSNANRRKRLLKRVVAFLSIVVLLFTVNSLKLTAITLSRVPACGLKKHIHKAKCYDGNGNLICGKVEHQHTDACYQVAPNDLTLEIEGDGVAVDEPSLDLSLSLDDGVLQVDDSALQLDGSLLELDNPPVDDAGSGAQTNTSQKPTYELGEKAKLSKIIKKTKLGVSIDEVNEVGVVDYDGTQASLLSIEQIDGDYIIAAARDFDEVDLAIVAEKGIEVVRLVGGRMPPEVVEQTDPQTPSEVAEETPSEVAEQNPSEAAEQADVQAPADAAEQGDVQAPADAAEQGDVQTDVQATEETDPQIDVQTDFLAGAESIEDEISSDIVVDDQVAVDDFNGGESDVLALDLDDAVVVQQQGEEAPVEEQGGEVPVEDQGGITVIEAEVPADEQGEETPAEEQVGEVETPADEQGEEPPTDAQDEETPAEEQGDVEAPADTQADEEEQSIQQSDMDEVAVEAQDGGIEVEAPADIQGVEAPADVQGVEAPVEEQGDVEAPADVQGDDDEALAEEQGVEGPVDMQGVEASADVQGVETPADVQGDDDEALAEEQGVEAPADTQSGEEDQSVQQSDQVEALVEEQADEQTDEQADEVEQSVQQSDMDEVAADTQVEEEEQADEEETLTDAADEVPAEEEDQADEEEQAAEEENASEEDVEAEEEQPTEEENASEVDEEAVDGEEQAAEEEQADEAAEEEQADEAAEEEQGDEAAEEELSDEAPAATIYSATIDLSEVETYPISLMEIMAKAVPSDAEEDQPEAIDDAAAADEEAEATVETAEEAAAEEEVEAAPEASAWTIEYDTSLFSIEAVENDYLITPIQSFERTQIIVTNDSRYELTLVNCVLADESKDETVEQEAASVYVATIDLTDVEAYPLSLNKMMSAARAEQPDEEQAQEQAQDAQPDETEEQTQDEQPALNIEYDENLLSIEIVGDDHLITPLQSFERTVITVESDNRYELTLVNCALTEAEETQDGEDEAQKQKLFTATIDLAQTDEYPLSLIALVAEVPSTSDEEDAAYNGEPETAGEEAASDGAEATDEQEANPALTIIEYDETLVGIEPAEDDFLIMPLQSFESTVIVVDYGARYALTLVNCVLEPVREEKQMRYEGARYTVIAHLDTGSELPGDAMLVVKELDPEEEEYQACSQAALEALEVMASGPTQDSGTPVTETQADVQQETGETITETAGETENTAIQVHATEAAFFTLDIEVDGESVMPEAGVDVSVVANAEAFTGRTAYFHNVKQLQADDSSSAMFNYSSGILGIVGWETVETKAEEGPRRLDYVGADFTVSVTFGPDAGIPEDAVLDVREIGQKTDEYDNYSSLASDKLNETWDEVASFARFFDITFLSGGEEIEPAGPVDVQITFAEAIDVQTDGALKAVHFDGNGETQVLQSQTLNGTAGENASMEDGPEAAATDEPFESSEQPVGGVAFSADAFSVFGVLETGKLTSKVITAEGETFEITVTYRQDAHIPDGAMLYAEQIPEGSTVYADCLEQAEEAVTQNRGDAVDDIIAGDISAESPASLPEQPTDETAANGDGFSTVPVFERVTSLGESTGTEMRLYDISIRVDGEEFEPEAAVDVCVTFLEDVPVASEQDLHVIHIGDESAELLDARVDAEGDRLNQVSFETESFSNFAFVSSVSEADLTGAVGRKVILVAIVGGKRVALTSLAQEGTKLKAVELDSNDAATAITIDDAAVNDYIWEIIPAGDGTYYVYSEHGYLQINGTSNGEHSVKLSGDKEACHTNVKGNSRNQKIQLTNEQKVNGVNPVSLNLYNNNANDGFGAYGYGEFEANNSFYVYALTGSVPQLDGMTYYLVTDYGDDRSDCALQAQTHPDNTNRLQAQKVTVTEDNGVRHVQDETDLTIWHFRWAGGSMDQYYVYTTDALGNAQYLNTVGDRLFMGNEPQAFKAETNDSVRVRLSWNGKAVNQAENYWERGYCSWGNESFGANEAFYLVKPERKEAEKVGASALVNNQTVIIYKKGADGNLYAIDGNGGLVRVYDIGGSIYWLGNRSVEWTFTAYTEGSAETSYCEFRNNANDQYLAPQVNGVLSAEELGVTLDGRRNGEYASTIEGWDAAASTWAGLNYSGANFVPGLGGNSGEFMFAVLDHPEPDRLHTVPGVDSASKGIKITMYDFAKDGEVTDFNWINGRPRAVEMTNVMGEKSEASTAGKPTQNLVNRVMGPDGHPVAFYTDASLGNLFNDAHKVSEANGLFLKSVYDQTGYYSYDSAQNYAYLNNGEFTLYRELAAPWMATDVSRNKGNFFPYVPLEGLQKFSDRTVLYDDDLALMGTDNPQYDRDLYMVPMDVQNYYFGMTMEAQFYQGKNGRDERGQPIRYEFNGDDDMWVFIDGVLVLDIGGCHDAVGGYIDFETGDVYVKGVGHTTIRQRFKEAGKSDEEIQALFGDKNTFLNYSSHSFKMYYMERGAYASNLKVNFNLPTIPPGKFLLRKELAGTDQLEYANVEYGYNVWEWVNNAWVAITQENAVYQGTDTPVKFDAAATINGMPCQNVFYLRPGEVAEFYLPNDEIIYSVQELGALPAEYDVEVNDTAWTNRNPDPNGPVVTETDYATTSQRGIVTYRNILKPRELRINKVVEDATQFEDPNQTFTFRVLLESSDGQLVPYNRGTYYIMDAAGNYYDYDSTAVNGLRSNGADPVPHKAGVGGSIQGIPVDYDVVIRGLLPGTDFRVFERDTEIPVDYEFTSKTISNAEPGTLADADGSIKGGEVNEASPARLTLKNTRRTVTLTVTKAWFADGAAITGDALNALGVDKIYFNLYRKVDDSWTLVNPQGTPYAIEKSQGWTWTSEPLPLGQYMVAECAADGETQSVGATYSPSTITLAEGRATGSISIENPLTSYEVEKRWSDSDKAASDYVVMAQLKRKTADASDSAYENYGTPVVLDKASWTYTWPNLSQYDYQTGRQYVYIAEESAVYAGRSSDADLKDEFLIQYDRTAQGKTIISNTQYHICIRKVDDKGSPLAGAWFRLLKGMECVDVDGHDDEGNFIVEGDGAERVIHNLGPGEYALKEVKTPTGYIKTVGDIEFEIKDDGSVSYEPSIADAVIVYDADTHTFTITVTNEPGASLPATGGPGTTLYYAAGAALLLLAIATLIFRKKADDE